MGKLKIKKKNKRPRCRRCNSEYGGQNYLTRKESYGIWICDRCGYIKHDIEKEGENDGNS